MREIKFRAFNKAERKMCRVVSIDFTGFITVRFPEFEHESDDYNDQMLIEEFEPLMQFTGLYDKNGKEIYEGDILNLKTSKHNGSFFDLEIETTYKQSVIEWWQSHSNIGYRLRDAKGKTMMVKPSSLNTMEAEVIGNIYENPELLEESK